MRSMRWFGLILAIFAAGVCFAGDIQVTCEPALRVYLDGKFVGTSASKDDGLFLSGVAAGAHVIRVEKEGFAPQSFEVTLDAVPVEVKVAEFVRGVGAAPREEAAPLMPARPSGTLVVTSAPQKCDIEVDGRAQTKTGPVLRVGGLAPGEHTISFSRAGYDPISRVVRIEPGEELTVRGNFKAGKVETVYEGKGALRVVSTPDHCAVRFLGKTWDKTRSRLNVTYVPAGEHQLEVSWGGMTLSTTVLIRNGQRTVVNVSFLKGEKPFTVSWE